MMNSPTIPAYTVTVRILTETPALAERDIRR